MSHLKHIDQQISPRAIASRFIRLLCALSFVFVTFTHSFAHEVHVGSATQAFVSSTSIVPKTADNGKIAPGLVTHCHTCSTVAALAFAPALTLPSSFSPTVTITFTDLYHLPVSQPADTPPPKQVI